MKLGAWDFKSYHLADKVRPGVQGPVADRRYIPCKLETSVVEGYLCRAHRMASLSSLGLFFAFNVQK